MSLFYKYANGSAAANMHEVADGDSLHLTATSESIATEPQTGSAAQQH